MQSMRSLITFVIALGLGCSQSLSPGSQALPLPPIESAQEQSKSKDDGLVFKLEQSASNDSAAVKSSIADDDSDSIETLDSEHVTPLFAGLAEPSAKPAPSKKTFVVLTCASRFTSVILRSDTHGRLPA